MQQEIQKIYEAFLSEIKAAKYINQVYDLKSQYLGKKSSLNNILKNLKDASHEERIKIGKASNIIKKNILIKVEEQIKLIRNEIITSKLNAEKIDITLDGYKFNKGVKNPLYQVIGEIKDIFLNLGYETVFGNEIETDEYNFQLLNLPIGHPARAMQDTFYIDDKTLLRTHCTNITAQKIQAIKDYSKPVAIISAGNVYRRDDDDATHSHQFMQIDGFLIAPNISFANLKWTLEVFCQKMFGSETKIKLRPSYFPFTEPSVEVDISCFQCKTKGCSICKNTGFIEVLGAGMISPYVFKACGQSDDLRGFAFGIGVERIAMLKYGVKDIRDFYTNDITFLDNF